MISDSKSRKMAQRISGKLFYFCVKTLFVQLQIWGKESAAFSWQLSSLQRVASKVFICPNYFVHVQILVCEYICLTDYFDVSVALYRNL